MPLKLSVNLLVPKKFNPSASNQTQLVTRADKNSGESDYFHPEISWRSDSYSVVNTTKVFK